LRFDRSRVAGVHRPSVAVAARRAGRSRPLRPVRDGIHLAGMRRRGRERLLRYRARPPFALERLQQIGDNQLFYRLPQPRPDGSTQLRLTPLELIERLAALIPPPRMHRHRYHGVHPIRHCARRSPLWRGRQARPPAHRCQPAIPRSPPCARRLALCGRCCLPASTRSSPCAARCAGPRCALLTHLGEPTTPPEVAPARGPPLWDPVTESVPHWGAAPAPVPEYVLDQRQAHENERRPS
jgi:Putative transposase